MFVLIWLKTLSPSRVIVINLRKCRSMLSGECLRGQVYATGGGYIWRRLHWKVRTVHSLMAFIHYLRVPRTRYTDMSVTAPWDRAAWCWIVIPLITNRALTILGRLSWRSYWYRFCLSISWLLLSWCQFTLLFWMWKTKTILATNGPSLSSKSHIP